MNMKLILSVSILMLMMNSMVGSATLIVKNKEDINNMSLETTPETVIIHGYVISKTTTDHLLFSTVTAKSEKYDAWEFTTNTGNWPSYYSLEVYVITPYMNYTVTASHFGYETKMKNITLYPGNGHQSIWMDFYLKPNKIKSPKFSSNSILNWLSLQHPLLIKLLNLK